MVLRFLTGLASFSMDSGIGPGQDENRPGPSKVAIQHSKDAHFCTDGNFSPVPNSNFEEEDFHLDHGVRAKS